MRVVLDTNVLASMAIARTGTTLAALRTAWQNEGFEVAISQAILVELERTLGNPFFASRLHAEAIQEFLGFVQAGAALHQVSMNVIGVAAHPEDDRILALAVDCSANYLVTGDKPLQKLSAYQGIPIISPSDFARALGL